MKRILAIAALVASLFFVSAALAADIRGPHRINDVYVIHFIIDGTNLEAFNRAMSEGRMPVLKERFVDRGAVFSQATSLFPSTSTCVYQAFATGLMPGHAGIPHLERFDRDHEKVVGYLSTSGYDMVNTDMINLRALMNPDVAEIEPPTTLFELLKGYPTAAVYSSFSRGAAERYPKIAPISALWSSFVSERQENVDVIAMKRVMDLFKRPASRIPRYTLVGLYSSDLMGHKHGPQSKEVADVLHQFDLFMSDFLALLEKQGIADKTYIIVSADHGMHETGRLFHFNEELKRAGIAVKSGDPKDHKYTLYAANRGVASSHVYVRHDGGFAPLDDPEILSRFPKQDGGTIDLIELIRGLDATDLVIVRAGERRARVFERSGGWADLACYTVASQDFCSYIHGRGDPLGYETESSLKKLVDGRPHSIFAWRTATAETPYPDAVVGFSQIFHDGRAGDLFVTTRGRYGFRKVKAGNHGGAKKEDMRIPMIVAGPTVPHGEFGVARAVDLYPLVLEWFGIDLPQIDNDGMNPFRRFEGDDPALQKLALLDQDFDNGTPSLKRREYAGIKPLVEREAERRRELAGRLDALLTRLKAQKASKHAPAVVEQRYLDDHIGIVERTLAWARIGVERMERIESALRGK